MSGPDAAEQAARAGGADQLSSDFSLLKDAVAEAGELAMRYFGKNPQVSRKADGTQVSEADLAADRLLKDTLLAARPDYGWLSEETPDDHARLAAGRVWIVDPIDGTRAFLQARSDWAIAAALVEGGRPILAAVFNPARGEFFSARLKHGAWLNGERIKVDDPGRIEGSRILASPHIFQRKIWARPWPPLDAAWVNSIAYRVALVAAGRAHASFSSSEKSEWDLAAPALLVQEAGGAVTTIQGEAYVFNKPAPRLHGMLAAGPELHRLMLERLSQRA